MSRALAILALAAIGAAALFAVGAVTDGTSSRTGAPRESEPLVGNADAWFFHQRAYPGEATPPGALGQAVRQTLALRRSSTDRAATTIGWTRIGPNPIATVGPSATGAGAGYPPMAGRVSAIAPAPSNSNIVYLGGANGGIWKSTDGGANWAPVWPNTMTTFSIGSIAVNPANANDVWVGTGEANPAGDAYYGYGIFHSTNGGTSWVKVGGTTFDGCFVSGVDFVSASVINAAVLELHGIRNPTCAVSKRGVWHITNANTASPTVTKVSLPGSTYQEPNNFASAASMPNTVYVSTYHEGVWRSLDGGASWAKIGGTTLDGYYREAISAYDPSTVYVALSDSTGPGFGGLKRINSADTSPTITTIANAAASNSPCTAPSSAHGQCGYDLTVAADPMNKDQAFVGGIRVYRFKYAGSPTAGTPIGYGTSTGKIHVDQHASVFDSAHNLWEGSDGGAYRLPAAQLGVASPAFQNRNGTGSTALGITEFHGWLSGSTAAGIYLGGTQDNGTVKFTTSTGLNWRMDTGSDGGASAYISPSTYFTSYFGTGLNRTTNGGTSFSQIFTSTDPAGFFPPLAQAPGNVSTLYRGTDRIWRTTNDTATTPSWTPISPHFSAPVTAIGVQTAASPAYVYAGTDAGSSTPPRLYYTHTATAAGPTWAYVKSPGGRYITDVWVSPANPAVALLTESGFNQDTPITPGHVFKTANGGATWTNVSGNLPNVPVNAVAVDPTNANKVFLGTDTGVFWTTNGAAASPTWVNTSSGLPNTTVMDLMIDKYGSSYYITAATHGRSAWRAVKP